MRFVCLFGPTGVGKTELLLSLFGGRKRPPDIPGAEIISADSMQVYRGMDIGTAKPSPDLQAHLPHHLIDIRNPDQQFHAGDFVADAERVIAEIEARGNLPVISGGTAFYFRNLLYGLPGTPRSEPSVRATLYERVDKDGVDALFEELASVDPQSARRISPSDTYRIVRALEVYRLSGRPLSSFAVASTPRTDIEALCVGLNRDNGELDARVLERTRQMIASGLVAEVRGLLATGYSVNDPGMRGIGYRETCAALGSAGDVRNDEAAGRKSLEELAGLIALHTRQYAKRQMTFFRRLPGVQWLNLSQISANEALDRTGELIRQFVRPSGASAGRPRSP